MVEGGGLESRCAGLPGTVGSNPTLSAKLEKEFDGSPSARARQPILGKNWVFLSLPRIGELEVGFYFSLLNSCFLLI